MGAVALLERVLRSGRFVASWIFTTDPRRVGVLWISLALLMLVVGGLDALRMRTELALPGEQVMGAEEYEGFFSSHGTVMVFFYAVPVFFGFASLVIPKAIGATNLAFPRLNTLDLWLIGAGGLTLEVGNLTEHQAGAGWTGYVPLTLDQYLPGPGTDWWAWAISFETLGTLLGAMNILVTVAIARRPGLRWRDLDLFTWSMVFTSLLVVVAAPFLITNLLFLTSQRVLGVAFFPPNDFEAILLWQDLFWFYSHPATYVMLLPALGIGSVVLARFAGRPLFAHAFLVVNLAVLTLFSYLVWWHHMFTTGMPLELRKFGSGATWAVSIPSGAIILTWVASLWRGSIRWTTPMLFVAGILVTFTMGGADGVFMSYIPLDYFLHETYWLVAHLHYIIIGSTFLGTFAGIYYWFPLAFGVRLSERLGQLHFWGTVAGINLTFFPMHLLGLEGMRRRIWDYLPEWTGLNLAVTVGAFVFAAAQLAFAANVVATVKTAHKEGPDPWGPAGEPPRPQGRPGVSYRDEPPVEEEEPPAVGHGVTYWPAVVTAGLLATAFLFVLVPLLALAGLLVVAAGVAGWLREVDREEWTTPPKRAGRRSVAGAAAVAFVTAAFLAAALRAGVTHAVFDPAAWPAAAQALSLPRLGITALLALAVGAGWGATRRPRLALTGAAVLGLAAAALVVAESLRLAALGVTLDTGLGAVVHWTLLLVLLLVLGGVVATSVAAVRAARDRLHDAAVLTGVAWWWTWVFAAWLVVELLVFLHVVPLPSGLMRGA